MVLDVFPWQISNLCFGPQEETKKASVIVLIVQLSHLGSWNSVNADVEVIHFISLLYVYNCKRTLV